MVWQLCFGHCFSDKFAQDCATKLARQEILIDWMKTKYQKNTMNSKFERTYMVSQNHIDVQMYSYFFCVLLGVQCHCWPRNYGSSSWYGYFSRIKFCHQGLFTELYDETEFYQRRGKGKFHWMSILSTDKPFLQKKSFYLYLIWWDILYKIIPTHPLSFAQSHQEPWIALSNSPHKNPPFILRGWKKSTLTTQMPSVRRALHLLISRQWEIYVKCRMRSWILRTKKNLTSVNKH